MKLVKRIPHVQRFFIVAAALGLAALSGLARADETSDEAKAGAELFANLKQQGEIVKSTPLYNTLNPLATQITKVVQPQYPLKMHFYVVHENQPNAFAAPGGNVYVIDSLFYFVKNKEELAGVLCHETSHLIHHDSMNLMKKDKAIEARAVAATVLLGPSIKIALAAATIARLHSLTYSRDAEEQADLTGADTCAKAGFNPWGLVWLFQDFANAKLQTPPEILSDHPNDQHRVQALIAHFKQNPKLFGNFHDDRQKATPLELPSNEAESFLR